MSANNNTAAIPDVDSLTQDQPYNPMMEAARHTLAEGLAMVLQAAQLVASNDEEQAAIMIGCDLDDVAALQSMTPSQLLTAAEQIDVVSLGLGSSLHLVDLAGSANRRNLIMRRLKVMAPRLPQELVVESM